MNWQTISVKSHQLTLSGLQHPYAEGKLGVIEPSANIKHVELTDYL